MATVVKHVVTEEKFDITELTLKDLRLIQAGLVMLKREQRINAEKASAHSSYMGSPMWQNANRYSAEASRAEQLAEELSQ